jgi:hypothetical protein
MHETRFPVRNRTSAGGVPVWACGSILLADSGVREGLDGTENAALLRQVPGYQAPTIMVG